MTSSAGLLLHYHVEPGPELECSNTGSKRQRVNLEVPAGQLEVGRLLLRCMYQQQPDLSTTEQATLLQLLVLADRYAVPAAVAAVGRAFKNCPAADLQWEAVCGAYSLPASCADNAAFADVYKAAADALQHTLGDLELVFADDKKQQLLLDLPQAALLQLLRDERTRVSSENTAAHAVLEWANDNNSTTEQMQQLVSGMRPALL
jgi:acyl-CoA synthetase (NDP forming)